MAQLNWTYVSDTGRKFNVGIYHGSKTGHLVVYCNLRVVMIDFNVLDTKTYPLFLDDELCELTIEKKNNQFRYGFDINRKADTPRNRQRKVVEKKHWRQTLLFFGAMGVIVALFAAFFLRFDAKQKSAQREELLADFGRETIAHIDRLQPTEEGTLIRFSFVADGKIQVAELPHPSDTPIILAYGMPLEEADEFRLRFVTNRPGIWDLRLDKPSEQQVERYSLLAQERHAELHPELSRRHIQCLAGLAYDIKGVGGLADFYFQDASPERNAVANELTYKRLVRGVPFQQRAEGECW
ncbi:MAG: hypothetical protein H6557_23785 [Lewinellaceae bacterium]|nr:hypothetical protein [Phaeodactylibacter sp.]MCB9039650.1 hypothetical protein [Lewinellaceae bacterium]